MILNLTTLLYEAESEAASTSENAKVELGAETSKLESAYERLKLKLNF